jgi:hypothetical protein
MQICRFYADVACRSFAGRLGGRSPGCVRRLSVLCQHRVVVTDHLLLASAQDGLLGIAVDAVLKNVSLDRHEHAWLAAKGGVATDEELVAVCIGNDMHDWLAAEHGNNLTLYADPVADIADVAGCLGVCGGLDDGCHVRLSFDDPTIYPAHTRVNINLSRHVKIVDVSVHPLYTDIMSRQEYLEITQQLPRISRELYEALQAAAKQDRRTLRMAIEIACEEWLARRKPQK